MRLQKHVSEERARSALKLTKPRFRVGYCLKPGFRYDALKPYCESIIHVTDGFTTDLESISSQIALAFSSFNPELDCIVPVGTAITNLLTGYLICQKFAGQSIAVAFYQKEIQRPDGKKILDDYQFYQITPEQLLVADTKLKGYQQ